MNDDYASQIKSSSVWNQEFHTWDDILEKGVLPTDAIPTADKVILLAMRTGQILEQNWSAGLREFSISLPQMNVLEALFFTSKAYLTQEELSRKVFSSKANISSLIGRMEQQGYILREANQENRRQNHITITKKGSEKVKEIFTHLYAKETTSNLNEEELQQLLDLLLRFKRGQEHHE